MTARGALVASAALAAVAAAGWWLWPREEPAAGPTAAAPRPPSEFRGLKASEQEADGTRWTLTAEKGTAWESESTGGLVGVSVVFERNGRQLRARAGRGEVSRGEAVTLSQGVELAWDQYRVQTEQAIYERGKGRVRSQGSVELRGEGLRARGGAVEVDVEGRRARVTAGVHAVFSAEAAP